MSRNAAEALLSPIPDDLGGSEDTTPARSRGAVGRAVRFIRELTWRSEYRRLEALRDVGRGRRAFLLGNGPSLTAMDLSCLDGEFVCLANLGIRALGESLSHADMHIVMDTRRYRRFSQEIEDRASRGGIPYRFLSLRMRARWRSRGRGERPYFIINNDRKLAVGAALPDLSKGVVTGSSVLISASVLLTHMGFNPIYVIGCDLDYQSDGKYFYAGGTLDRIHEADPAVIAKRQNMTWVNREFAILRTAMELIGRRIVNAGVGGSLESLPRVTFDALFADRTKPVGTP